MNTTTTTIAGHGGVMLAVTSAGDPANPPILLVHGWSQAALSWTPQFRTLAKDFFLVAPDLRGHGASGKPGGDEHYGTSDPWAGDIAEVIAAFDLDRPVIVGWSMGGYVVQDYLSIYGEDAISGTVLIGTCVTKGPALPEAAKAARGSDAAVVAAGMLSEDLGENIAATLAFVRACSTDPLPYEDFATAVGFNMACPPRVRRICRQRAGDYRPTMSAVTKPVLVMWGDAERLAHRSMYDQSMETIPTARGRIYHGLGHMPFYEDPAAFNADLADFVRDVRETGTS